MSPEPKADLSRDAARPGLREGAMKSLDIGTLIAVFQELSLIHI
jgi:hypothetical protein